MAMTHAARRIALGLSAVVVATLLSTTSTWAAGPLPTARQALGAIFGGTPGNMVVGMDGSQTSFWHEQGFRVGQDRYHAIFLKTRLREPGTKELASCHACSARISAVVYKLIDDNWQLDSRTKDFTEFGSWGDAPVVPPAQLLAFPNNAVAFLFDWSYSGQGFTNTGKAVFRYAERQWTDLGGVQTGGDNSGAALDPKEEYAYEGVVSVVPGRREVPDLAVTRRGTDEGPNGRPVRAKSVVYRFNGTEYKELP